MVSPFGKRIGSRASLVMMALAEPSRRRSRTGGISKVTILFFEIKVGSTKQCDEPQSRRARKMVLKVRTKSEETEMVKDSGSKRAEALSRASLTARSGTTQPSARARIGRLLVIFSGRPKIRTFPRVWRWQLGPSPRRRKPCGIPWQCVRSHHRKGKGCCRNDVVVPPW